MNEVPSRDKSEMIELALTARWGLSSPNPRFVTQLEHVLLAEAENARASRKGVRLGFPLIRLPLPGWLAVGVAIMAIVAGVWFAVRSMPPTVESVTATPAITTTSTIRASFGAMAAPEVTLLPGATPSPALLAPQLGVPQTAPAPPAPALLGPDSSALTARAPRR